MQNGKRSQSHIYFLQSGLNSFLLSLQYLYFATNHLTTQTFLKSLTTQAFLKSIPVCLAYVYIYIYMYIFCYDHQKKCNCKKRQKTSRIVKRFYPRNNYFTKLSSRGLIHMWMFSCSVSMHQTR